VKLIETALSAGLCCAPPPPPPAWYKPLELAPPPRAYSGRDTYLRRWALDNAKNALEVMKHNTPEVKRMQTVVTRVENASKASVEVDKMKADVAVDVFKLKVDAKVTYKEFVAYTQKQDGSDWVSGLQIENKKLEYNANKKIVSVGYTTRW
jgi:hypothetical protein